MKIFDELIVGNVYSGGDIRKLFPGINSTFLINYDLNNLKKIINNCDKADNNLFIYIFVNLKKSRKIFSKMDFALDGKIYVALKADNILTRDLHSTSYVKKDVDKIGKNVKGFYRHGTHLALEEMVNKYKLVFKKRGVSIKPETKKHFGDIVSNLTFNESYKEILEIYTGLEHDPTPEEMFNFKLNANENKILDLISKSAWSIQGNTSRHVVMKYITDNKELVDLIERTMGPSIIKVRERYEADDNDEKIQDFIKLNMVQSYMSVEVLIKCFYENPEIDFKDLVGLISHFVNKGSYGGLKADYSPEGALEYLKKSRNKPGDKINVDFMFFLNFRHSPKTLKKVAEQFLKYCILADLSNTNYMSMRLMRSKTEKHFGDILGELQ